MRRANYFLLDVFTKKRYGGNQLAVFPDAREIPEDQLQKIAKELNLSETVYLTPTGDSKKYKMRIFTPGLELPTAGHPTIGTAFYLARELDHPSDAVFNFVLEQKVGPIQVAVAFKNNLPELATMDMPTPRFGTKYDHLRTEIAQMLDLQESDLLETPIQEVSSGVPYIIVPVRTLESVRKISFQTNSWKALKKSLNNAFIYAFAPQGQTATGDLHGRMFAPDAGILEDPATGSANGPLGAYVKYYELKEGPYLSEQGFEMGRPSFIHINIESNSQNKIESVKIGGNCIFVGSGTFFYD
ncbi:MAG: PhzF family phenazine biosynthesis protein [Cyclobacteriaceae bacterium]|nr:PhzF family phenazine biosynthesis protein [Cyclobacteriaceae bacterium HetDA_MAG_MS6]